MGANAHHGIEGEKRRTACVRWMELSTEGDACAHREAGTPLVERVLVVEENAESELGEPNARTG